MANEKLKQLPLFNPATDSNPKNLFWCSVWQSGDEGENGTYVSKRVREGDLKPELLGYKKFVATVNQTGSNAPTMTILENTFGVVPTWEYVSQGQYDLVFPDNTFPDESKIVTIEKAKGSAGTLVSHSAAGFALDNNSNSTIKYFVFLNGDYVDTWLYNAPIEIRVYE